MACLESVSRTIFEFHFPTLDLGKEVRMIQLDYPELKSYPTLEAVRSRC
jgi:hypothetical protein